MSLRLLSQDSIADAAREGRIASHLRQPQPLLRLAQRAVRCTTLAESHPLADYLRFVALLAQAQAAWLQTTPALTSEEIDRSQYNLAAGYPPLNVSTWPRDDLWRSALQAIARTLAYDPDMSEVVRTTAQQLLSLGGAELESLADSHLNGDYAAVGSEFLPFVSAALSVYWSRLAAGLDVSAFTQEEGLDTTCPVCGSAPSVGVVSVGQDSGLRYLHCALCESEWHVVRAICSSCGTGGNLDYFSLDQAKSSPVRAEACHSCGSYLKVLYPEHLPQVDAVADDLATLSLDLALAEQGQQRSGPCLYVSPG
jgi:FdhE protein